jgi:hypothetical protein
MQSNPGKYDVAVCWRIYPGVSKDPLFYKDDKFKLAQLSFNSFISSSKGLNVKYFIILDGCAAEFEKIFTSQVNENDIELIRTKKIGNAATFKKQIDVLLSQTDAEFIYFAEDDYLYTPGGFKKMVESYEKGSIDFMTPYDHLDYYEHPLHRDERAGQPAQLNGHTWKPVLTTCLSFLTTKKILSETLPVFESYGRGNTDASIWITLTRKYLFSSAVKFYFTNRLVFFVIKKAMKYNFGRFMWGKRYTLSCPVPAVATHLEAEHISPGVDWKRVKEEVERAGRV